MSSAADVSGALTAALEIAEEIAGTVEVPQPVEADEVVRPAEVAATAGEEAMVTCSACGGLGRPEPDAAGRASIPERCQVCRGAGKLPLLEFVRRWAEYSSRRFGHITIVRYHVLGLLGWTLLAFLSAATAKRAWRGSLPLAVLAVGAAIHTSLYFAVERFLRPRIEKAMLRRRKRRRLRELDR